MDIYKQKPIVKLAMTPVFWIIVAVMWVVMTLLCFLMLFYIPFAFGYELVTGVDLTKEKSTST